MKIRLNRIEFGVGIIAALVLLATPAHAVESFGVGARPGNPKADNPRSQSIFVYEAKPGTTVSDTIIIANNSQSKKIISVYGVDSQNSSDGAFACAQAADVKAKVGNWITLGQSEVTLEPNKSVKVPFTLTVPSNADVGEHNGCIAVQPADAVAATQQNGISLSFRSALRVAVTIPGELKSDLKVAAVKHSMTNNKFVISPTFKNTGNVSVDAAITTRLDPLFGTMAGSAQGTFPVLRDADGTFNFEIDRPFWGGYYSLVTQASYKPLASPGAANRSTNELKETIFVAPHPLALLAEIAIIVATAGLVGFIIWRRWWHLQQVKFSRHHTIKQEEDIESIASDYGVPWQLVARINHLKAPYILKTGDRLLIPGHKVRKAK